MIVKRHGIVANVPPNFFKPRTKKVVVKPTTVPEDSEESIAIVVVENEDKPEVPPIIRPTAVFEGSLGGATSLTASFGDLEATVTYVEKKEEPAKKTRKKRTYKRRKKTKVIEAS